MRQPPGPGLLVGGHFYSVTFRAIGAYAMIRLRDVSHAVSEGLFCGRFILFYFFAVRLLPQSALFRGLDWWTKRWPGPNAATLCRFSYAALCAQRLSERRRHSSVRPASAGGGVSIGRRPRSSFLSPVVVVVKWVIYFLPGIG